MASTSTQPIVLPSIHEMFPEHLIPLRSHSPAPPRSHRGGASKSSRSHQSFSFDVLKSHPRGASLEHLASSRHQQQHDARSSSSDGDAEMADVDAEESGECGEDGKKHVCPTCGKRFNRPSSLRIHVNTHTGATPFRCPYPNCNRAFNVNSNMRRHYRNHGHPTYNTSPSTSQAMPMHTYPAPSPPSPTILPHASWNGHGHAPPMHNFPPPAPYPPQSYLMAGPHSQRGGISRAWTPPAVGSWSAPPKRYSESDVRSERR